jgi:hypothetical protein
MKKAAMSIRQPGGTEFGGVATFMLCYNITYQKSINFVRTYGIAGFRTYPC